MSTVASLCTRAEALSGVPAEHIIRHDARHCVSYVRSAVILVARRQTGYSYKRIGRCLDNRDHSTIWQAARDAEERERDDKHFRRLVRRLTR